MIASVSRRACLAAVAMLVVITAGCSRDPRFKPTYQVSGRLFFEGQPAGGATVALVPANPTEQLDPWVRPRAPVSDDGSFTITTYKAGDGVPTGEYALLAFWFPPGAMPHPGQNKLPDRYSTLEGSAATVVVKRAAVDVGTIALTR